MEQAQDEQREAVSLTKAVQQAAAQKSPAAIYVLRDWKHSDFIGCPTKLGEVSVEEWIASVKSAFQVMKVPEKD